jgi:hypothetical protein
MPQITAAIKEQWPIPTGLPRKGRLAAKLILEFLAEKGLTDHGGGGKFYSPKEWRERGESYAQGSQLVITHDGGDHACAFNYDYEAYALMEELRGRLQPHGIYIEQCASWFSAVYLI